MTAKVIRFPISGYDSYVRRLDSEESVRYWRRALGGVEAVERRFPSAERVDFVRRFFSERLEGRR